MNRSLLALALVCFTTAVHAEAGAAAGPSMVSNILMLVGFLFIFYFMLIRPQTKRAKDHQSLVSKIEKDDEVIINGGMLARVTKVADQFLVVAIADGIEVKVQKQAVSASLPKGTMKSI
jgi:preprotein translocase subunit YajC